METFVFLVCFLSPEDIHNHFKKYEVEYLQFAFRWMNNLLMRELPLRCTIRLWDTYQVQHCQTLTVESNAAQQQHKLQPEKLLLQLHCCKSGPFHSIVQLTGLCCLSRFDNSPSFIVIGCNIVLFSTG